MVLDGIVAGGYVFHDGGGDGVRGEIANAGICECESCKGRLGGMDGWMGVPLE